MRRSPRVLLSLIALLGVLGSPLPSLGQAALESGEAVPITTDWSHQHVIFSRPSKPDQAARVEQDIRYWQQLYRHQTSTLQSVPLASSENGNVGQDWAA